MQWNFNIFEIFYFIILLIRDLQKSKLKKTFTNLLGNKTELQSYKWCKINIKYWVSTRGYSCSNWANNMKDLINN